MEAAPISVFGFLTRFVIPVAFLTACVGLVTIGAGAFLFGSPRRHDQGSQKSAARPSSYPAERVAVAICCLLSLLALVVVVQAVRFRDTSSDRYPLLTVLLAGAFVVMGLPALLWRTRARRASEGAATLAVAVTSVLTGFSIGFAFIPLAVLMIWVCVRHLIDYDRARNPSASVRVDSPL